MTTASARAVATAAAFARGELNQKVQNNVTFIARNGMNLDLTAVAAVDLFQQRQGFVITDEAQRIPVTQRFERAKNSPVPDPTVECSDIEFIGSDLFRVIPATSTHPAFLSKF